MKKARPSVLKSDTEVHGVQVVYAAGVRRICAVTAKSVLDTFFKKG
jgi:hypothetical protein